MVTDTKRILRTDPGRPEVCNVCQLHRFFGDDYEEIWDGERTARTGCVDTKKLLAERIIDHYAARPRALRRADGRPRPRSTGSSRPAPSGSADGRGDDGRGPPEDGPALDARGRRLEQVAGAPIAIPTGRGRGPLSPLLTARVAQRWDGIRSTYWFVPLLMIGIALVAALATIQVDAALVDQIPGSAFLSAGGADGARTLLSVAAAAMITVAGVTYSIALVPMALVTAAVRSRGLLRNYMRDLGNQVALGMFLATFVLLPAGAADCSGSGRGPVRSAPVDHDRDRPDADLGRRARLLHPSRGQLAPDRDDPVERPRSTWSGPIANLYPGSIGFEPPAAAAADVAAIETAIGGEADPSEARLDHDRSDGLRRARSTGRG